jgi:Icc-related predicted phosphoesterase
MPLTRIFFTSDVHGSDVCFLKFINAGKFYQAHVLILGGDITGKMIVPIVELHNGTFTSEFLGTTRTLKTKEQRDGLENDIRNSGYYPYVTTPEEMKELSNDVKLRDELFLRVMVDGVKRWVQLAEERLKGTTIKCYISPGNDDSFMIDEVLKSSSVVLYPEDQVVQIDDHHEMITSAWTNPSPWKTPREAPEEKITHILEQMTSKVERMENCIFNLHAPPYNTTIDVAPELDETLKPKISGTEAKMIHVGSVAVRAAIEKEQPLLGIHGHIHESQGFIKIGRTVCINPGSDYSEGILRGALININEKEIRSYLLTQG